MLSDFSNNDPSRDRLLLAAVEIFAVRGFRDATVREICAKAEVNAASVNYYFGGKEKLYAEALGYAFRQADLRYPMAQATAAGLSAEARLAGFIHVFLHKLLDETALGHHTKLVVREIADPTNALSGIIETAIAPQFMLLRELLPALLGPDWSELDMHRCILSIIGQCLVYKHSRSVIHHICPDVIADAGEIERTAAHIARFSLAALKGLAEQGPNSMT
jgi:AcrR family transcriptional regulator